MFDSTRRSPVKPQTPAQRKHRKHRNQRKGSQTQQGTSTEAHRKPHHQNQSHFRHPTWFPKEEEEHTNMCDANRRETHQQLPFRRQTIHTFSFAFIHSTVCCGSSSSQSLLSAGLSHRQFAPCSGVLSRGSTAEFLYDNHSWLFLLVRRLSPVWSSPNWC